MVARTLAWAAAMMAIGTAAGIAIGGLPPWGRWMWIAGLLLARKLWRLRDRLSESGMARVRGLGLLVWMLVFVVTAALLVVMPEGFGVKAEPLTILGLVGVASGVGGVMAMLVGTSFWA